MKVLLVGLPYLRSLTVPELEAVLLHEFGHFLGDDVHRGERLATIVARTGNLRTAFDRTGLLRWCNPVYLWVRLYQSIFSVATAPLRRNQEMLADALAASTCGPTVYSRGLLKAAATRRIFARVAARRVQRIRLSAYGLGPTPTISLALVFHGVVTRRARRMSSMSRSTCSAVKRNASSRSAVRLPSLKKPSAAACARSPRYTLPSARRSRSFSTLRSMI